MVVAAKLRELQKMMVWLTVYVKVMVLSVLQPAVLGSERHHHTAGRAPDVL